MAWRKPGIGLPRAASAYLKKLTMSRVPASPTPTTRGSRAR
jgi:hypothetical protein